jgi:hypothetical protein
MSTGEEIQFPEEEAPAIDPNTPSVQKRTSDLYRLLKLAEKLSSKCIFSSYQTNKLKETPFDKVDEYAIDSLISEFLSCEAHLELTQRVFATVKQELFKAQNLKMMNEEL